MFGYGNWKDIARHVESKNEQQVKERYIKRFINGAIGIHTWKEDLRSVGQKLSFMKASIYCPVSFYFAVSDQFFVKMCPKKCKNVVVNIVLCGLLFSFLNVFSCSKILKVFSNF